MLALADMPTQPEVRRVGGNRWELGNEQVTNQVVLWIPSLERSHIPCHSKALLNMINVPFTPGMCDGSLEFFLTIFSHFLAMCQGCEDLPFLLDGLADQVGRHKPRNIGMMRATLK